MSIWGSNKDNTKIKRQIKDRMMKGPAGTFSFDTNDTRMRRYFNGGVGWQECIFMSQGIVRKLNDVK